MVNFFTDNPDLVYQFENLAIEEIVSLMEQGYAQSERFAHAPADYADAIDSYRRVLESAGSIAGNTIAPRAAGVDIEGARLENGKVAYAEGTREALMRLSQAELMGMTLPREYGGLNLPTTIYIMAIEMVSRADASLMNLYGLQDIGETINEHGSEEQRREFLPKLSSGRCTGAMALTEPDAGSDLQAVKLQAIEGPHGNWMLRGVKRFITNGCGEILLVLARSEPGTRDARGLSLFVCYGDDTVTVRRIERKLGIHGSPTCELQFDDTPAQLIGRRKFGLIRYVMDLMNGARLGVAAQALGVAQAAYEEAVRYARARRQFGKPIAEIPVVSNMLISMRVMLESNRSLLYSTAQWVDLEKRLATLVAGLRKEGKPFSDEIARRKEATRIAALLTPITKYVLSESANRIAYDSLQIHGGAGYMREFSIERLVRDARITNIYEGTSQMQIVAAAGGVMNDILADHLARRLEQEVPGDLVTLADHLREMRALYVKSLQMVTEKDSKPFTEVATEGLVKMYAALYVGVLLLDEAKKDDRKALIAKRYMIDALAQARRDAEAIMNDEYSDLACADRILADTCP